MFDKIETGGSGGRLQLTEFKSDENCDITTKHTFETQASTIVFESWEYCSYTTINGITGLLKGKKLTATKSNTDVDTFQLGDALLAHYLYHDRSAILLNELHWSDDIGKFLTTTYIFDDYGNETSKTDHAGLTTSVENNIGRPASLGANSLISATSSLLNTVAHNVIENQSTARTTTFLKGQDRLSWAMLHSAPRQVHSQLSFTRECLRL